jgi:ribose transport system substrate-binding protein
MNEVRLRGRLAACVVVVSMAALVAACGSDSNSGSENASTTGSSSSDSSGKAAAQKVVDQAMKPNETWLGPTSSPKPATGKTIGIMPCGAAIEGCNRLALGTQEAAKVIGWKSIFVDGKGDAQVQLQAMNSLINRGVDGIVITATDARSIGDAMAKAKQAGIPVVATMSPTEGGLLTEVGIDDKAAGKTLAAYTITHGGGGTMLFTQTDSPAVAERGDGYEAGVKEWGGPNDKIVAKQFVPNSQLGPPLEQAVAAILQKNPKPAIQWGYAGFDFMETSVVNAVQRAGRTEIKGVSFDGNKQNIGFIRDGNVETAVVGYPLGWAGWGAVDQLNRAFNGKPIAKDEGVRYRLLDKSNLPAADTYDGDYDYKSKYRELWGK